MPVVMGTAGHIDHGKTTLIKALTGIDCDRLAEEKKRGITIELGFAFADIGDHRLGIVDVPGHERFVKNMVAGATGIDFVLMVIAADEGIMPQTREHMEICSLLGIDRGIIALTKADMVDEEWLAFVQEDVRSALQGSFLQECPIIPVSAHTGQGLETLKEALATCMQEVVPDRSQDLLRIPIDRAFSMKGHGTVVTGTMISGSVRVGQDVQLYPGTTVSKVRRLQSHGQDTDRADSGKRTAVNLQHVEVKDVVRGEVVASPDTLFPKDNWIIDLTCLSSSPRPIKHRKEIHFHHGTEEVMATIYFLDRDRLEPGERAGCQVRFTRQLTGVFGDRFVIRSFSPLRTIGGGRVLHPLGEPTKGLRKKKEALARLAHADVEERVLTHLELSGNTGRSVPELRVLTNIDYKTLDKLLNQLTSKREISLLDREQRVYIHAKVVETLSHSALEFLQTFHANNRGAKGLVKNAFLSDWGRDLQQKLANFILEKLVKAGQIVTEKQFMKLPEHEAALVGDASDLKDIILKKFQRGGTAPPTVKEVAEKAQISVKEVQKILNHLMQEEELVKVSKDLYFHSASLERLTAKVQDYFQKNKELSPSDFKALSGLSRKFAIPVLEYLDREKVTMRVGDIRMLRGQ